MTTASPDAEVVRRQLTSADAADDATVDQVAGLLQALVAGGAALGWVDPPSRREVAELVREVAAAQDRGDARLVGAWAGPELVGIGWWRRYTRPTHRPHADIDKVAVAPHHQGRGVGRLLLQDLVGTADDAGIEVLTLDFRGDNERAARLYRSLGFREYGRLERFVAVGEARYDKVFYARDSR